MKKAQFLRDLANLMEVDNALEEGTDLKSIEEFDSLAVMGVIAYADRKFAKRIPAVALAQVTTVGSLMDILGREQFE